MTDLDMAVLDVEARFWRWAGAKERHVKESLGLSPARYYQLVAALLDDPEALAYAPLVVHRLRRLRQGRRRRLA